MSSRHRWSWGLGLLAVACSLERDMAPPKESEAKLAPEEAMPAAPPPAAAPQPMRARGKKGRLAVREEESAKTVLGLVGGQGGSGLGSFADARSAEGGEMEMRPSEDEGGAASGARSWFPETFLFAPMIETDARGLAEHEVRVPDRLTTWRVLALAHSRDGAQAGALTSFLGTLPVYLDPVLPSRLAVGDEIEIPIQIVNTTDQTIERRLEVEVEGGGTSANPERVVLAPRASTTRRVRVSASRAGTLRLSATLSGEDAIVREARVEPTGRPVRLEVGGTLAAPRTPRLEPPRDLERETARLRLSVFPGALAILRSELAVAIGRDRPADDAYLLMLAGRAESLLRSLGAEPDRENLRRLRIAATQRAMKHNRASAPEAALLFLPGAFAAREDPVLERLAKRLSQVVSDAQRGDGTFLGSSGWTVQQLLVATAEGVSALSTVTQDEDGKRRHQRARLLASGAVERLSSRLEDPYTAATLLAAKLAEGPLEEKLRAMVKNALETREDGTKWLVPDSKALRSDGSSPTAVEATAFAVLALSNDAASKELLPDLGAALLGSYRAHGFGDGRTNLVALAAVLELFEDPLPAKVTVRLLDGDRPLAEGVLEGAALKEVLVLEAKLGPETRGNWRIVAEPPVPGLGYHLELRGYVPWTNEGDRALHLAIDVGENKRLGRPVEIHLSASSPGGAALIIQHALPAGVVPDEVSLEALVDGGALERFETRDGELELHVPARGQGQIAGLRYRVLPTSSGRLHATASRIRLADGRGERYLPSADWVVAR